MNAKVTRFIFALVLALGVVGTITMPATNVSAKAARIAFTGTEMCSPDTMTAMRLWMAGPNLQVRGWTETCNDTADIPQMTGTVYLYDGLAIIGRNYIINVKFRMETTEGGVWVGTALLAADSNIINCVGHGEGIYEGLELHWFLDNSNGDPKPFYGYIMVR